MALNLPNYPNPFDPNNPIENAYAWLAGLMLDNTNGQGRVIFNVHPNESAYVATPIGQVSLALGQLDFTTLPELMADPEFAAAYQTIGTKLYQAALKNPAFSGATVI